MKREKANVKQTEKLPAGTYLQGYARTTYSTLVKKLGHPTWFDRDKNTVQWVLEDNNGNVVTVYDYKQKTTPKGEYDWHLGGRTAQVLTAFTEFTGVQTVGRSVET